MRNRDIPRLAAAGVIAVAALAAVGVVRFQEPVAAQSRPCTCEDLGDIQRKLDLTHKQLDAWKKVLDEVETQAPGSATSADTAGERFCGLVGLPKDCVKPANKDSSRAGGVNPDTLEPEINPKFAAAHCADVVDSVTYHEQMHKKFVELNRFNVRVILGVLGWNYKGGARTQSWNEIFAHEKQIQFLEDKKAAMEKDCEPHEEAYLSDEQKEEQKLHIASAEKRVTAYAQTIG